MRLSVFVPYDPSPSGAHSVRASSHGSVVPPGATSLRLMAELPGASLTLRSALAPPTDEAELEWICGQAFVDAELADLEAKAKEDGVTLNADQLSKIAAKADVEAEIEKWESLGDMDLGKKIICFQNMYNLEARRLITIKIQLPFMLKAVLFVLAVHTKVDIL